MPFSVVHDKGCDDLRDLARSLCESALQDPDLLVFSEVPFEIATPRGLARVAPKSPVPLWTFYVDQARNMKRLHSGKA
jgi:hypothetical protein